MADIIISNVDEQVKQNFERFCVNAGMNMAAAFSALVKVGISINEQGLLIIDTADELRRRQRTDNLKKIFAEAQAAENDLTDEEWTELENIRSKNSPLSF